MPDDRGPDLAPETQRITAGARRADCFWGWWLKVGVESR
jgi:hypothetical protein